MTRLGAPLSERQLQILLAVVQEHIRTRRPVGSRVVREVYGVEASTATIRNEMMELEQAGLLYQPHTSAGRVPSDRAYRIYVNYLRGCGLPDPQVFGWIEGEYRRLAREPHELLRQTSRLLARLTSHPAVATLPPLQEPLIEEIRLQPISATSVLFFYKTSEGREHQHLLSLSEPVTAAQIASLEEVLRRLFVGRRQRTLSQISAAFLQPYLKESPVPEALGEAIAAAVADDDPTEVYVEGTSYILDEPEFAERARLRALMRLLDQHALLRRILQAAEASLEMTVTIGAEHQLAAMRACSLVVSSYPFGQTRGVVGILGPTRMDYARAMGTVAFIARKLGETLADLQ